MIQFIQYSPALLAHTFNVSTLSNDIQSILLADTVVVFYDTVRQSRSYYQFWYVGIVNDLGEIETLYLANKKPTLFKKSMIDGDDITCNKVKADVLDYLLELAGMPDIHSLICAAKV